MSTAMTMLLLAANALASMTQEDERPQGGVGLSQQSLYELRACYDSADAPSKKRLSKDLKKLMKLQNEMQQKQRSKGADHMKTLMVLISGGIKAYNGDYRGLAKDAMKLSKKGFLKPRQLMSFMQQIHKDSPLGRLKLLGDGSEFPKRRQKWS